MNRNDESVQYILPLLNLLMVVWKVPTTREELQALLEPMSEIVQQRLDRLYAIVHECVTTPKKETTR